MKKIIDKKNVNHEINFINKKLEKNKILITSLIKKKILQRILPKKSFKYKKKFIKKIWQKKID